MLLMFVGGVMNLAWMAAIAIYVLAEKIAPRIRLFSWLTGVGLAAAGILWMGLALAG
jgi:predicted metal-binding membrane protein